MDRRASVHDGERVAHLRTMTCVPGVGVGHAWDEDDWTGCTLVVCPQGAVGGLCVVGSAPSTRQLDALAVSGHVVPNVHGVFLTGGSSLGLGAADGAVEVLAERGIGWSVAGKRLVTLPTAVLFDLRVGRAEAPGRDLGRLAAELALGGMGDPVRTGCVGAGAGATVGKLYGIERATKSGLGSFGVVRDDGLAVGALAVVNAYGDVWDPNSGHILAGARDSRDGTAFVDTEQMLKSGQAPRPGFGRGSAENTTLAVVATNAELDVVAANKVAQMASAALYRCIRPVGTMVDGDLVVALSVGGVEAEIHQVGVVAAHCLEQAILGAVRDARSAAGLPAARDLGVQIV